MKKFSLLFIVLIMFALILTACSGGNEKDSSSEDNGSTETADSEYEPEDIDPDTDVCEVCGMAIADDEHATQIILENDKSLKYDDIGDMFAWLEENGDDDVGAKYVRDFNTQEWIQLEDASFVYDEDISTPMGYGVISFKDSEEAEAYIDENDMGELLSIDDLNDHEWDMDHDHGDHEHGDHDDDEHAFHTEGFDMNFTELDDVPVADETELEINMTMDDEALEDAEVRYEIWPEDDEDSTDWVDATENEPGQYVADYTFEEAGTYHIQVHATNDDLHEHLQLEVSVKE